MKFSNKTHKLVNITLVLIIILLVVRLSPLLKPLLGIFQFFIIPLILAIYVFYALYPLKRLLSRYIKSKAWVATLIFIVFLVALVLFVFFVSRFLFVQVKHLTSILNYEYFQENNEAWIQSLPDWVNIDEIFARIQESLTDFINHLPTTVADVTSSVGSVASGIGSVGTQMIIFLLATYYLLADSGKLGDLIQESSANKPYGVTVQQTMRQIHYILRAYITGQIFVSIILSILMFIGFTIVKLPYAGLIACMNFITNLIPFVGPFIGGIPAVLLGLTHSWVTAMKVLAVVLISQQIESHIITPQVIGSRLSIHPFTVIIIVLAGLQLFGAIGSLIATPLYMTLRIIITNTIDYQKKRKAKKGLPASPESPS